MKPLAGVATILLATGVSVMAEGATGVADPFAVVAAFGRAAKLGLWPGFDASSYPLAVYDGERTLLFRHPSPPDEFAPLEGHDGVWVSPGQHPAMRWNSNADIGGVRTATLLLTIEPERTVEYEAHILFHEVFHLFSKSVHPGWRPNEMWRYSYPVDDLDNYRLLLLEEEALARAMEAESDAIAASWAAAALSIRSERTSKLSGEHRSFETLLELQEGTAVYMGRSTIGIAGDTERLREERGPEGIRWRCYETGAALAVILDRLMPSWKRDLDSAPETTFAELLQTALAAVEITPATFSDRELAEIESRAKASMAALAEKTARLYLSFKGRGKRLVVHLADGGDHLAIDRFDPMAVEVLDRGDALHAHLLTAVHPRGELSLVNPRFARGSMDGVIALTRPAGEHPFVHGIREISVSGFSGEPAVDRSGDAIAVTAEGLSLSFEGADVQSTGDELVITVLPATAGSDD